MYLGVQETGTCVSINRITVYYFICLPRVANLTSYPTAVPNGPMTSLVCMSGASVVGTQPPAASCGSLGVWGAPIGGSCACSPGYTQLGQICQRRLPLRCVGILLSCGVILSQPVPQVPTRVYRGAVCVFHVLPTVIVQ